MRSNADDLDAARGVCAGAVLGIALWVLILLAVGGVAAAMKGC